MAEVKKNLCNQILIVGPVNFQTCIFTCTPEGYRKDTGSVTDPLTDLLTDPLTDLLTDPLTGKLRRAWRLSPPEGYRKDSRPFWWSGALGHFGDPLSCEMLNFTCTPEGYRKDTGRIPEGCQTSVKRPVRKPGIALQLYLHAGRIPEGYRKG